MHLSPDMRSALIGYTGFVGGNIADARQFTDYFNTSNIEQIRGRSYDLLVTAGSRADSHRINQNGAADRAEIDAHLDLLSTVTAARVVHISTICIYPEGSSPDETTTLSDVDLLPYGANRLHMERILRDRFDTLALRLPQLYGRGLKKGIIYDLMNDYRVEFIRPLGRFQYYDLRRLWADACVALDADLETLNLATPPLTSASVASECFGRDIRSQVVDGPGGPRGYTDDMRTIHGDLWSGPPGYLMDEKDEIDAIRRFVAAAADQTREN